MLPVLQHSATTTRTDPTLEDGFTTRVSLRPGISKLAQEVWARCLFAAHWDAVGHRDATAWEDFSAQTWCRAETHSRLRPQHHLDVRISGCRGEVVRVLHDVVALLGTVQTPLVRPCVANASLTALRKKNNLPPVDVRRLLGDSQRELSWPS